MIMIQSMQYNITLHKRRSRIQAFLFFSLFFNQLVAVISLVFLQMLTITHHVQTFTCFTIDSYGCMSVMICAD